jgi:hypothetical protein
MTKYASDIISIMRKATGRMDASDPLFTDQIMLGYINDYYTLIMGQELRIKEKRTWWNFVIDVDDNDNVYNPMPVNLQEPIGAPEGVQFTTIGPYCTADGFEVFWYEDPGLFYSIWPETQVYTPQRPTYVLYYNNELVWRGPPDRAYDIKINAYQVEIEMATEESPISSDYLWRYIAYGAAIDLLNDYREFDVAEMIRPRFEFYRSKVWARTMQQQQNQRSIPSF